MHEKQECMQPPSCLAWSIPKWLLDALLRLKVFSQIQDIFMWALLRSPPTSAAVVAQALHESARNGRYLNGQGQIMPDDALPQQANDAAVGEALWAVSENLLGKVQA